MLYMAERHVHIITYFTLYTDSEQYKGIHLHILSIVRWSAGANVRQQHSLSHDITLYFDVQLQWAVADQQAMICIHLADNHDWMAQQVVESSSEGQQIHTVQVTMQSLPPNALPSIIADMNM